MDDHPYLRIHLVLGTGSCISSDGMKYPPGQCLLDPNVGIAFLTGYDRFQFLNFTILFYSDAALAVNLAVICEAVMDVTTGNFNATIATGTRATVKINK